MKVSIGIDIGANGAWAMFVGDNKLFYGLVPKTGDELDMKQLLTIIKTTIARNSDHVARECERTKLCQETEGFKGTEHEGVDVCTDGCVHYSPLVDEQINCVIEDLHSVFGSSAKSNFQFGVNNGLIIGMLQCSKIPYTKIGPKKWQKEMWQGIRPVEIPTGKKDKEGNPKYKIDTKATSLIAAKRLFPNETFLATERSKKPHDGIVDAVLMAEYCRRSF